MLTWRELYLSWSQELCLQNTCQGGFLPEWMQSSAVERGPGELSLLSSSHGRHGWVCGTHSELVLREGWGGQAGWPSKDGVAVLLHLWGVAWTVLHPQKLAAEPGGAVLEGGGPPFQVLTLIRRELAVEGVALSDSLAAGCVTTLAEGSGKSLTRGSSGTGAEAAAGAEEGGSQWTTCLFPHSELLNDPLWRSREGDACNVGFLAPYAKASPSRNLICWVGTLKQWGGRKENSEFWPQACCCVGASVA